MRQLFIGLLCGIFFVSMPLKSVQAVSKKSSYTEIEKEKKGKKIKKDKVLLCGVDKPIRVASFVTNPPFGWVEVVAGDRGQKDIYTNKGYGIDLFTNIAHNLQYRVKSVPYTSYLDAMKDLRKGNLDVIAGTYYNRSILGVGVNLLTPGYLTNPIVAIFVKGYEKPYNSFDDLKGLKGIVRQEEMIYPLIHSQLPKDVDIKVVSGSKKAFKMLMDHEVDFMVTSLYSAEAEVRRFKLVEDIYFPNKSLLKPELFFAFSSHSDCFTIKPALSKELKRIQQDKTAYMQNFMSYIDNWGETFRGEAGLLEETPDESETGVESNATHTQETIDELIKKDVFSDPQENASQQQTDGSDETQPTA